MIGCPDCIERVRTDQVAAAFQEWFESCEWDEPELPQAQPTKHRERAVYAALRCRGYDRGDVRAALALWECDWDERQDGTKVSGFFTELVYDSS